MTKIEWDIETGGVLLKTQYTDDTLSVSPRPVFFEELNILKLQKFGWQYPNCEEPLLWACNKQYYYRGQFVFEAKGANIYEPPTILMQPGFENLKLVPVDVKGMLHKNKNLMFLIESEAIEFIRDIYTAYTNVNKANTLAKSNHDVDYEVLAEKIEKHLK